MSKELEKIIMPLGKHKGKQIKDIPCQYLDWLVGQDWLRDPLKTQIEQHLETRPDWQAMDDMDGDEHYFNDRDWT